MPGGPWIWASWPPPYVWLAGGVNAHAAPAADAGSTPTVAGHALPGKAVTDKDDRKREDFERRQDRKRDDFESRQDAKNSVRPAATGAATGSVTTVAPCLPGSRSMPMQCADCTDVKQKCEQGALSHV